jgi:hypothetical protein
MIKALFPLLLIAGSLYSQDITLSKDSLWLSNSLAFSRLDLITVHNSSATTITLDSAEIVVGYMDTTKLSWIISMDKLEFAWRWSAMSPYFIWSLKQKSAGLYGLKKEYFIPSDSVPLTLGPDETKNICRGEIGFCFICNSLPTYPLYFRGTLKLYFSNRQAVSIKLYTSDLRTGVVVKNIVPVKSPTPRTRSDYLINGRKIPQKSDLFNRRDIHRMIIRE